MNAEKRKTRTQQRDKKNVAWDEAIVVEEPPQMETPKEFEEGFKLWKRTQHPKDPLYQRQPDLAIELKTALNELEIKDVLESEPEDDGFESDGDGWFD